MPKKRRSTKGSSKDTKRPAKTVQDRIGEIEKTVARHDERLTAMSKSIATRTERETIIMDSLGLTSRSKKGDHGIVGDLSTSVLHLDEYLLKNSERIDKIFTTLKNHREMLTRMNEVFFKVSEKDRIKVELAVMKNTLSIIALAGNDLDMTLIKDIKEIQESIDSREVDIMDLRKSKTKLDKKFDEHLKKFDIEAIYLKRKNIPGYV